MSSVNVGVDADVGAGMRTGISKYFLSFTAVGFVLPLYLLLLSGFPFFDAVKVVSVVLLQIAAGASIWLNIMNPRSVAAVESVGMGLALGSIFGVVGHQLFLSTPIRSYGWLLPVVVALVVHFFSRKNQITRESFADSELSSLLFVVLAVVVILTQWWWLLPLALPTGLALYMLSATGQRKLAGQVRTVWVVTAVLFIAATFVMLYLRQLNLDWWIRSWDLQFHESRSYSVAKFGPSENISIAGNPLAYHWLGLAWLGSISIVCDLAPWLSVTQVGPIYVTVVIGSLIWTLAKKLSGTSSASYILLFSFAFGLPAFSASNPPNMVSLVWLFATIISVTNFFEKRENKFFTAVILFSLSAFASKISTGFTILFGFILSDLYLQLRERRKDLGSLIRTVSLGSISLVIFIFLINPSNSRQSAALDWALTRPSEFFGVEIERRWPIQLIGLVGFLTNLLLMSFLPVTNFIFNKNKTPTQTFMVFGFASVLIPSFAFRENFSYFVLSAQTLIVIATAVLISAPSFLAKLKQVAVLSLTLAMFFAIFLTYLYQWIIKVDWSSLFDPRGGVSPIRVLVTSFYFLLVFFLARILTGQKKIAEVDRSPIFQATLVSILLLVGTVAYSASSHLKSLPSRAASRDLQNEIIGADDTVNASAWVMKNSASDDVFATNRFCIKELDGVRSTCAFPKFFGVSAATRRRLLIEGPSYSVGDVRENWDLYPVWAKERLDLSRGFADNPNAETTAKLREYGVDWFYLFKENTTNRNWEPYGTVKYENTEVAIIKLNDE
jgi:hypothetical protein